MTAELGNPVCRNLVPEWAVALCWFQNSLPTCFCVLVAVDQEGGWQPQAQERQCLAKQGKGAAKILACRGEECVGQLSITVDRHLRAGKVQERKVCFRHCFGAFGS